MSKFAFKNLPDWKTAVRAKHGNNVKFEQKKYPGGGIGGVRAVQNGKELPHRWDVVNSSGYISGVDE